MLYGTRFDVLGFTANCGLNCGLSDIIIITIVFVVLFGKLVKCFHQLQNRKLHKYE